VSNERGEIADPGLIAKSKQLGQTIP
ncbi:hypothetical protein SAMN05216281_1611, partial [Cryobacterium luteum]